MAAARDDTKNILEKGPLHHLMVFFQRAQKLPGSAILFLQGVAAAAAALSWHGRDAPLARAWLAAASVAIATLADAAFLRWLPRARISFGPWKAQTVVLLVPRTLIGVALALAERVWPPPFALALLFAIQGAGSLLLWWAAAVEPKRLALTRLKVKVSAMPPGARPVKLLHISDIHLERMTAREEKLLSLAKNAEPDLVVITGDFLNLSYNRNSLAKEQISRLLRQLDAPYGVYATLGSPPVDLRDEILPVLQALPLRLLRDEWISVQLEAGNSVILIGLDCTHHLDRDGARLEEVAKTAPGGLPRVLLYHSPELMPQAAKLDIDLYLCGHTHGGQVRLPFIGPILTSSQLGRRYVMGLYKEDKTRLYVSRGVGLEGLSAPRVRLLAPPEITLVTLCTEGDTAPV